MSNTTQDTELTTISPSRYFEILKNKKKQVNDQMLNQFYDNALSMLNKYNITGQTDGMKKLIFLIETVERERELIKLGIDTFVYYDDIAEYIDHIAKKVVKIIELERYERDIPDEVVEIIKQTKGIFDQLYVVFTDYTGEITNQALKEKDPILFGTFQDKSNNTMLERFYFLADWEDEFCDLTLGKMVAEVQAAKFKNIVKTISTPADIAELKQQLANLTPQDGTYKMENVQNEKKTPFFRKITLFKKGEKK